MEETESTQEVEVMLVVSAITELPWIDITPDISVKKVSEYSTSKEIANTPHPLISIVCGTSSPQKAENYILQTNKKCQLSTSPKPDTSKY